MPSGSLETGTDGFWPYILQNADRRIVFVIPYERDFTLIGTTDVPFEGDPASVAISEDETDYLLGVVSAHFERPIGRESIVWTYSKSVGVKPSPIIVDDLLYTIHDQGILTCLEAKTGEVMWKKRLDGEYSASPLYAKGQIYFFSHDGPTTVIRPGRTFEELAVNHLDAGFMASPAVVDDAIFLRTKTHLYRIEEGGRKN